MKSFFDRSFFATNRRHLREKLGTDATIVVTANGLLQRRGDSAFAFSQDAHFWYLTGIDDPDIVLIMDAKEEYVIVPGRSASRQAFDGTVAFEELAHRSGIKNVLEDEAGWEHLFSQLKTAQQVATVVPAPPYIEQHGLYSNPARMHLLQRLKLAKSGLEVIDISAALAGMRMIKQPAELRALQKAIDITVQSIDTAISPLQLKKYNHEYELEAALGQGFRSQGATGHGFEPIVAGGANACTLHNIANNSKIHKNDLLVIDVGAEVEHYSADITRTVCAGKPSARQKAVHQAVLDVQAQALELIKPGIDLKRYEQLIEVAMGEQLLRLQLITKNDHQSVRRYYPHATSHFLGLNVHDVGDYSRPLEPDMVLTVEPGIYIPEEGIGVRVEDDVLVTKKGNKILSDALPRTLA